MPVALVAYAIFGSSRQLVVGPVSTVSVLSGSLLASFKVAGTAQAASYTAALALGAGLVLVTAGFLGIGWVAEFLSKPIVTGFVLGLTILVILGELPHLLGVATPEGQVVERVGALGWSLSRGEADRATVIVSAVSLLVLFGGRRLARWVLWGLVLLIGGLVASTALNLQARGVEVVGPSWSTRSGSSWTSRRSAATPACVATTSSPQRSPPAECWPSGRCTACCSRLPGRCWAWSTGPAGSTSR